LRNPGVALASLSIARAPGKPPSRPCQRPWSSVTVAIVGSGFFWQWPTGKVATRKKRADGISRRSIGWKRTYLAMRSYAAFGPKLHGCWGSKRERASHAERRGRGAVGNYREARFVKMKSEIARPGDRSARRDDGLEKISQT